MTLLMRFITWLFGPAFSTSDTVEASERLCRAVEELQDELRKETP